MKNYLKVNTFRARPIDTVILFDDEDAASCERAWLAACEMAQSLAYKVNDRRVMPAIVVWRRPATPGPWSALGKVAR